MMASDVREAPEPAAVEDDLDAVFASGTRLAWSSFVVLLLAFVAVIAAAATDAGSAPPSDPVPPAIQIQEALR